MFCKKIFGRVFMMLFIDIMKYDEGQEVFNLAIQDYDSAIRLAPNDVASYINRGKQHGAFGAKRLKQGC